MRDHIQDIAEDALLEISRIQRETLERWFRICLDAGEVEEAERLRAEINQESEFERAA